MMNYFSDILFKYISYLFSGFVLQVHDNKRFS